MLVALIIAPLNDLARVRFVLLDSRVREQPYVIVHVEIKQRPRLASRLVDDEVIERVVLNTGKL